MKVLFVINMEDLGFEEPLGVLYLSAVAKKHNHKIYAVENNFSKIEKKIRNIKPDMIAVSVLTPSFSYLFGTIKNIKAKYNIPTILGGPHATFFPEIIKHTEIDYVFMGEAEDAFAEFLDLLETGNPIDSVSNLVMMGNDGNIKQNPVKPLVNDLDIMQFPDRELFKDHPQFYKADVRSVIASRGCPYNCSYCFNDQFHKLYKGLGSIVRLRSVDNVIEECLELKNTYKAKMIHFFDDIFPYKKDWLEEFTEKYKEKIDLPFLTNTRFNVCSEEYVKDLSEAGCKTLLIGVEAGNEELREKILNRKMSNQMMIEKSKLVHSYGIKIYTQNLIGLPFGSLEKDLETLKLNIDLEADYAGAYLCQPYPKTEIEKMAREAGLIDDSYTLSRSFYHSSPLKIQDKELVEKLRLAFSIIVNFPFLFRFTHRILNSSAFPVKIASSLLHGYKVKTAILRYRMNLRTFIKNVILFFSRKINNAFSSEIKLK